MVGRWIEMDLRSRRRCLVDVCHNLHHNRLCPDFTSVTAANLDLKYREWRRRYRMFFWLTSHPLVCYSSNLSNPPPRAASVVWNELADICPNIRCYKEEGVRHRGTLQGCFAHPWPLIGWAVWANLYSLCFLGQWACLVQLFGVFLSMIRIRGYVFCGSPLLL